MGRRRAGWSHRILFSRYEKNCVPLRFEVFLKVFLTMAEEGGAAPGTATEKVVHTYPLVRVSLFCLCGNTLGAYHFRIFLMQSLWIIRDHQVSEAHLNIF